MAQTAPLIVTLLGMKEACTVCRVANKVGGVGPPSQPPSPSPFRVQTSVDSQWTNVDQGTNVMACTLHPESVGRPPVTNVA